MKNVAYIILDRSGSMATMWEEAVTGINKFVKNLQSDTQIVLAVFDTQSYDVIRNSTVEEWFPLSTREVQPRGGTPLLDAAGRMFWYANDSKPERAIFVVVTDGEENSSRKFSSSEIKDFTKQWTNKNFEIVFIGANFDKIESVSRDNFGYLDNTRIIQTSARGLAAGLEGTASATAAYFGTGVRAASFYDDATRKKALSD